MMMMMMMMSIIIIIIIIRMLDYWAVRIEASPTFWGFAGSGKLAGLLHKKGCDILPQAVLGG